MPMWPWRLMKPGQMNQSGPVDHAIGAAVKAGAGVEDAVAAHGHLAALDDLVS